MRFDDVASLRRAGFSGFESVDSLQASRLTSVPGEPGVYLVVRPNGSVPRFSEANPAGRRRGRADATVGDLQAAWVPSACVLYIGKAGGPRLKATLRSRLSAYLHRSAGHSGGRDIWQLADAASLLLAWRTEREPRTAERLLIENFRAAYGSRPFANHRP